MQIRTVASYARLPPLNQSFGSPLVKTKMRDELRNLAMVNLRATDTLSLVRVSCFSDRENLLVMKTNA